MKTLSWVLPTGSNCVPLVTGEYGDRLYISSEEAAIRRMEPDVDNIAMPKAGEPVIGRVIS